MKLGVYSAAIGSIEQQKRLDVIANNIANTSSPGYKKDGVQFNNYLDQTLYTDLSQGPVRETGNKFDLALSGDGFLSVQTERGKLYTRAGNLALDKDKVLVTQDGWPVLGRNGPIRLDLDDAGDLRIEEDGQVFDGADLVDSLEIVRFPAGTNLKKAQGGCFAPEDETVQPERSENCVVRQGALEGANFNPVEEMVRMVETMRTFEAYQKTMQTLDRTLDSQVISKLSG